MTIAREPSKRTTAIGSLPHHNVDAALEWSFRMGIPFLPQIPIRNAWEYMIPQALEDLPGLILETGGVAQLSEDIWLSRTHALAQKLERAFQQSDDVAAFEAFEPSPSVSSAWQPFVWELSERAIPLAKIQIAGPLTSQWSLRLAGKASAPSPLSSDLSSQVFKLTLARALSMTRRLQASKIQPILFLDEPALYGLSRENPIHVLGMQELKILIQALKKEGVVVGLHCCSNTDWAQVLALGLDFVSIDTELSLRPVLEAKTPDGRSASVEFLRQGGRFSLGVVPTARSSVLQSLTVEGLFAELLDGFEPLAKEDAALVRQALATSLFTPACGLAFHSIADAELTAEILDEFYAYSGTSGAFRPSTFRPSAFGPSKGNAT